MQTRDHKMLADLLILEMEDDVSNIKKKAFVFGNIEPDFNLFTYLHGWVKGKKMHGHNYNNILPIMRKINCMLQKKKHFGVRKYYYLGKLIHYVADSFTFPHNQAFQGNLANHCLYERELHEKFKYMLHNPEKIYQGNSLIQDFHDIEVLHTKYLHEIGTHENDCQYIVQASRQIFSLHCNCRRVNNYILQLMFNACLEHTITVPKVIKNSST